jgi:hypothetical protein
MGNSGTISQLPMHLHGMVLNSLNHSITASFFSYLPCYSIQLWGCASDSNIQVIQCYQNKVLKYIVNTPWYFKIVTFIVILELRWLQKSSLSSPTLMKRDFKTTSTSKHPDFST